MCLFECNVVYRYLILCQIFLYESPVLFLKASNSQGRFLNLIFKWTLYQYSESKCLLHYILAVQFPSRAVDLNKYESFPEGWVQKYVNCICKTSMCMVLKKQLPYSNVQMTGKRIVILDNSSKIKKLTYSLRWLAYKLLVCWHGFQHFTFSLQI